MAVARVVVATALSALLWTNGVIAADKTDTCASSPPLAAEHEWRTFAAADAAQDTSGSALTLLQTRGFFDTNKQSTRKCGIVWYYHIPKVAGRSVELWFEKLRDEEHQIDDFIPLTSWGADGQVRGYKTSEGQIDYDKFEQQFIEPILENPEGKLVVIHHGDRGPGLYGFESKFADMKTRLQAHGCDLFRLTWLREPEELVNSALFFYDASMQANDGESAPEELRYETDQMTRLKKALATDKIYDNLMVRYLLNNKGEYDGLLPRGGGAQYPMEIGAVDDNALKAATDILRSFEFVGFTGRLDKDLQKVSAMLGLEHSVALPHESDMWSLQLAELPEDVRKVIQDRIVQDKQLWETAKKFRK